MTCGGCTAKITRAFKAILGVGGAHVLSLSADITVHNNEKLTSLGQLKLAINNAGNGVGNGSVAKKPEAVVASATSPHSPSMYGIRIKAALELFYVSLYVSGVRSIVAAIQLKIYSLQEQAKANVFFMKKFLVKKYSC